MNAVGMTVVADEKDESKVLWNIPNSLMAWQDDLFSVFSESSDNREIFYICETEGYAGNSAFSLCVRTVKRYV